MRFLSIMRLGAAFCLVVGIRVGLCQASPPAHDDVTASAAMIDAHIEARWTSENVTPALAADDAEFLRRVYLDIVGRIPTVAEVREFLADSSPDKRRALVDNLLDGPGYVRNFGRFWRGVMMPEAAADEQAQTLAPIFEVWVRDKLIDDAKYDELVRELLTTPLQRDDEARVNRRLGVVTYPGPYAFYQSKQIQPENLAAAVSRMFLGIRLECAQCHDHFFDRWKREEFWSFAAFFAGLERQDSQGPVRGIREVFDRREITIPDTDKVVQAAYVDGTTPTWVFGKSSRETMADWVVSRDNPYFARAAMNRLWGHFFGVGLVDPVDDFSANNPPSHPQLLDDLARSFADHDFDLKFMIRAIVASRAYGLTSRMSHATQSDARLFARMKTKGLTADQIFENLLLTAGYFEKTADTGIVSDLRAQFQQTFSEQSESPSERTSSILQSLAMMNSEFMDDVTSMQDSRALAAVTEYPFASNADRINTLYLAALARPPRKQELDNALQYVDSGGTKGNWKVALGDVYWALLNSSEFIVNH